MESGLTHYARNPDEALWKMMSQQPESLPDQGIERAVKQSSRGDDGSEGKRASAKKRPRTPDREEDHERNPRYCLVCRKRHEPRCAFPPEWRREQKERKPERPKREPRRQPTTAPQRRAKRAAMANRDISSQGRSRPSHREGF